MEAIPSLEVFAQTVGGRGEVARWFKDRPELAATVIAGYRSGEYGPKVILAWLRQYHGFPPTTESPQGFANWLRDARLS